VPLPHKVQAAEASGAPRAPSPQGGSGGGRKRGPADGRLSVMEADRAKFGESSTGFGGAHATGDGEQGGGQNKGEVELGMGF
jgi:hypothetical protein